MPSRTGRCFGAPVLWLARFDRIYRMGRVGRIVRLGEGLKVKRCRGREHQDYEPGFRRERLC